MKKVILGIVAGLALGAAGAWLALRSDAGPAPAAAASAESPKANPLRLTAAQRTAAGIALARPTTTAIAPEVSAFGRVLDPVPLIALVAEVETARASLAASEKDYRRLAQLHAADANASAQAVEAANAAMLHDRIALASARARLIANVGPSLASSADLDQMVAALERGTALGRVDVFAGEKIAADPKSLRVGLSNGSEMFDAPVLGAAPTVDSPVQGQGFLVLLRDHPFPTGAALRATLPGPGETTPGLVVPPAAIVYHQGSAWVYVLSGTDTFARKIVTLGRAAANDGVLVTGGIEPSDQVVTVGAQQLLSAELQAGTTPDLN